MPVSRLIERHPVDEADPFPASIGKINNGYITSGCTNVIDHGSRSLSQSTNCVACELTVNAKELRIGPLVRS